MQTLTSFELTIFLATIGMMLILARILSRIGRRFHVPTLVAELLAGIILGPTILGSIFPSLHLFFFPDIGGLPYAYNTLFNLAVLMLLFVAGMELDFSLFAKEQRGIIFTTIFSILIPFILSVYCGWQFFDFFRGIHYSTAPFVFPLIFGLIITLTSLPIIVRVLITHNLHNTPLGITIIGTAVVTDLIGWVGFSAILIYANPALGNIQILYTFLYIALFFIVTIVISSNKKMMKKLLTIKTKTTKDEPSYDIAMLFGICLLSAAFTNMIHIHTALGAFFAGIVCKRITSDDLEIAEQLSTFVMNFFAPIFFISIGLKLNFIENMNFLMVLAVFVLSCATKILGTYIGALLGGFNTQSSLIIASGLNARGAMEVIMGAVALKIGLIYPQLFVAFVISAIITSLMAEPLMLSLYHKSDKRG
jgi:Kef-type K+ transport system membrane component KefB